MPVGKRKCCDMEEKMNQIHFIGYDAIHPANFVFDLPEGHNCYLLL